jgi:hypothetical protein
MTAQLQNLFQEFYKLPAEEQQQFVRGITDRPTSAQSAELNRRFADAISGKKPGIDADVAIARTRARLARS